MRARPAIVATVLAASLVPPAVAGADTVVVPVSTSADSAADVAPAPGGEIVLAGHASSPGGDEDVAVVRLLPNGERDLSFGGGDGIVITPIGGSEGDDRAFAVVVEPDGEIVVAGQTREGLGDRDTAVVRYTVAGAPDPDFGGGDGIVTIPVGVALDDVATDLVREPDGQLVVAGTVGEGVPRDFAVVRLNEDGTLDGSFDGPGGGGNGVVTVSIGGFDSANAIVRQDDGKLVVGGQTGSGSPAGDFALVRLNGGDGSLDADFDGESGSGNGIVQLNFGFGVDEGLDGLATVGTTGLAAAGSVQPGASQPDAFAVARLFVSDGTLDDTFDTDGLATVAISGGAADDTVTDVAVQGDKPLLVGQRLLGDQDAAVARFTTAGALDAAFDGPSGNGNGAFALPFSETLSDRARGVAIDANGDALVAGEVATALTSDDFAVTRLEQATGAPDPDFLGDRDPPETTITAGPLPALNGRLYFEFTADEPATFECSLDGGTFAACVTGALLGPFADGAHSFAVRATDTSRNVDPTPATRDFTIGAGTLPADTIAPGIRLLTRGPLRLDRRGRVTLRISCPAAEPEPCAGSATVRTAKKVSPSARKRVLKLGSKRFSIPAGRTAQVRVKVSRAGRRLVSGAGRLRVRIAVQAVDAAGNRAALSRKLLVKKGRG